MFDFLKDLNVLPNEGRRQGATASKTKDRNPVDADIRIYRDGSVYPSATLAKDFELEYVNKDQKKGFGFDVIFSDKWHSTKNAPEKFILVAAVNKDAGKVDLFSSCTYDANGVPVKSVMKQGSANKQLAEYFGLKAPGAPAEQDLVLVFVPSVQAALEKATGGIYYIPKAITRGPKKDLGSGEVVRRENLTFYVLAKPEDVAALTEIGGKSWEAHIATADQRKDKDALSSASKALKATDIDA